MIWIAAIWLSVTVPLIVAAFGRHRLGTKVGALTGLAVVFAGSWAAVVALLGVLAAHDDASRWFSALQLSGFFLCGYVVIAFAALQRKLR